jgi:hypothetical protein
MTIHAAVLGGPWPHALFSVEERAGVLCLIDLGHGRSVANDAAAVIRALRSGGYHLAALRVFYRDTQGAWDEILIADGWFRGFRSLNCDSLEAALRRAACPAECLRAPLVQTGKRVTHSQ